MPDNDFFARMAPEFADFADFARESAGRQAESERLIAKAEYECYQLRRELVGLMAGIGIASPDRREAGADVGADETAAFERDHQPAEAA